MATTMAIFNQAGGVETTLAQNLGYHLTQEDKKILLIDLDSQASLTTFVGLVPDTIQQTIAQSLIEKRPLPTHSLSPNLDIVPSNRSLHRSEIQLVGEMARELRLKRLLDPLQPKYDFIFIDCPPSLSLLPILGLTASDYLLVPIQTHSKAFWGTDQLLATLLEVQETTNPDLKLAGVVPTLYEKRNRQDQKILQAIQEQLSQVVSVFDPIPKAVAFPEASQAHMPLVEYQHNHRAVAAFDTLTEKILAYQIHSLQS